MGLVFIPFYVRYLGIEAYGLIGLFAILTAWLTLANMGMTPALYREMARFTAGAHTSQSIRDLLRSLEILGFTLALLIGTGVWLASPWLASDWLRAEKLPVDTVAQAVAILGAVVALKFVEGLYQGAIVGLQRQVWYNAANASLATLRGVGAIGILAWVSPTIKAYFIWQGTLSLVTVSLYAVALYRWLPAPERPARFSAYALKQVWRFAGGMMATTLLALLLTQVDKVLLSKLLSLEDFGYYTLVGTVASVLSVLVGPITQAFYPHMTGLVARGNNMELSETYHQGAQLVSVLIGPPALVLALFGQNVLALWTGSPELAYKVAPLLTLLVLGTFLNGLMHIPYMLQLAYGWSGLAVRVNVVAVALLVPAILIVTPRYGVIGAAWVWVGLNGGYVLIAIHFMHKRLLPSEKWRWYCQDIVMPALAALIVAYACYLARPVLLSKPSDVAWLVGTGGGALAAAALAAPALRGQILQYVRRRMRL